MKAAKRRKMIRSGHPNIAVVAQLGQTFRMRKWQILFAAGILAQSSLGLAQGSSIPTPSKQQLTGLSTSEAASLIAKLEDAQRRIKTGNFENFELLSGSVASYKETNIPPRDAFLQVPFGKVWSIERKQSGNPLWQPYRLSYAPDGLGRPYWDIEVALGSNGAIERVLMLYKAPAPF
jgi:hypothetical protein